MSHICYFHIFGYRSIQNRGISLDARYTYEMRDEELMIRDNADYIEGLWPKGISSVSALVGENGTGKTTFLETMLTVLSGGKGEGLEDTLVVYEDEPQKFSVYTSNNEYRVFYQGKPVLQRTQHPDVPNVKPFYYSSAFRPYSKIHVPGDSEIGSAYNATDTWRLIQDLNEYTNRDSKDKQSTLEDYFDAYKAQDNNRIVQLICDPKIRQYLPSSVLPKFVLVCPNESGYKRMEKHIQTIRLGDFTLNLGPKKTKGYCVSRIVSDILYSIEAESSRKMHAIVESLREKWERTYNGTQDVLTALDALKQKATAYKEHLEDIKSVVGFLEQACTYNEDTDTLYMDLEESGNEASIQILIKLFQKPDFKVARYFDMQYSRDIEGKTQLSAGELDMLKLCSRLYDAAILQPKRRGREIPQLILIDEAENSYHPEWQRQFVCMFLNFMHALYEKLEHKNEFQVVFTTHSPILLSDIPKMCINYLERDKDGKVILSKDQPETFGANVFELYRHAFFMQKGLVGEYAQRKMEELQEEIQSANADVKDICKRIGLIGDNGIRTYLLTMLEEKRRNDMLTYYKSKVEELEQQADAANK